MQMLLNKNLLNEIEQILTKKQDGVGNKSIVKQINEYLDKFIEQVNEAYLQWMNHIVFLQKEIIKRV